MLGRLVRRVAATLLGAVIGATVGSAMAWMAPPDLPDHAEARALAAAAYPGRTPERIEGFDATLFVESSYVRVSYKHLGEIDDPRAVVLAARARLADAGWQVGSVRDNRDVPELVARRGTLLTAVNTGQITFYRAAPAPVVPLTVLGALLGAAGALAVAWWTTNRRTPRWARIALVGLATGGLAVLVPFGAVAALLVAGSHADGSSTPVPFFSAFTGLVIYLAVVAVPIFVVVSGGTAGVAGLTVLVRDRDGPPLEVPPSALARPSRT